MGRKAKADETELKPYKKAHARALPLQTDDMTAILNLVTETGKIRGAKQCVYADTEQGINQFSENSLSYFEYVNEVNANPGMERKLIPDVESWAVYLGITRKTICEYEKRSLQWQSMIEYYKGCIASVKKQLGMSYKIPPMVLAFDLANNHGYLNTNEFRITGQTEVVFDNKANTLERAIVERGLIWNEQTHEFEKGGT